MSAWRHGVILFAMLLPVPLFAQTISDERLEEGLAVLNRATQRLSERVGSSVVQIFTTSYAPKIGGKAAVELYTMQRGSGSGVIVDSTGYIVTNNHVIDGARLVRVLVPLLAEDAASRQSIVKPYGVPYEATVVGVDRETDLAVLKIDVQGLVPLRLSDSDDLHPGELVFAFGSPLGLSTSVSMGVVSAVARQLSPESPMIYVQTDAPINPGNSGGPLVNTHGDVVGINTLILSQSGGSEGIGFAAPSNIVKTVVDQIRANGRVRRSEIGVYAQTITPSLASALDLQQSFGVVLGDVYPTGPADKAGLLVGDIVLTLNGKRMENGRQLEVNLYGKAPGETVTIEVLRNLAKKSVRVPVKERQDDAFQFADLVSRERNLVPELGILALDVDKTLRGMLPPMRKPDGVLVAAIAGTGSLWETNLEPGDMIYAVNRRDVKGLSSLRSLVAEIEPGAPVALQIEREGKLRYVTLELQ